MNDTKTTRKHYIRVKADVQPVGPKKLRNANWRQSVFDDITNKGTTIAFKQLTTNASRYRLGLGSHLSINGKKVALFDVNVAEVASRQLNHVKKLSIAFRKVGAIA